MLWSPGAVAVEFRDVPQRHYFQCYSLHFITFYFITLYYIMNIKFDQLLSEIDHVLQKR